MIKTIKTGLASMCFISALAFASPGNDGCVGNCDGGTAGSMSQTQGQLQGQAQGQGQSQGNTNIVAPVQSSRNDNTNLNANSVSGSVSSRNDNSNMNVNSNKSEASAGAVAGATSKSSSGAIAGSYSGGNTQAVVVTDSGQLHYSGGYEIKNVPNVVMGNVYPTSPCMGSSSAGGSGVGFGISFGTSWTDDECGLRETSRSFSGLGMKADAVAVLCMSKYAAAAPVCAKAAAEPKQPTPTASGNQSCYWDEVIAARMNVPVCK